MTTKKEILKQILEYCQLKYSHAKLNWYLNNKSNIYAELKIEACSTKKLDDIFSNALKTIKEKLTKYEEIVANSRDQIVFPLQVKSGIYCLIQDDTIVYVGSAKNLLNRFSGHIYKTKEFNRIWFEYWDIEQIRKIESYYIWYLKYPKENKNAGENDFLISELLRLSGKLEE